MSTVAPPGFDLTDPDILGDRLPLDELTSPGGWAVPGWESEPDR